MQTYPKEWERHVTLPDGRAVYIRPLRPDDEPLYGPFLAATTAEDIRLRFFATDLRSAVTRKSRKFAL